MADAQLSREYDGWRLWFGTLGAGAAWMGHLLFGYALVPLVCLTGGVIALYILSLVAAAVAIASGFVAWQGWRHMSPADRGRLIDEMEASRRGFMAFGGLLAAGVFLLAIIMATVPIVFLNPCSPTSHI